MSAGFTKSKMETITDNLIGQFDDGKILSNWIVKLCNPHKFIVIKGGRVQLGSIFSFTSSEF